MLLTPTFCKREGKIEKTKAHDAEKKGAGRVFKNSSDLIRWLALKQHLVFTEIFKPEFNPLDNKVITRKILRRPVGGDFVDLFKGEDVE